MKKIYVLLLSLVCTGISAQTTKKNLTLEDIFKNGTFTPKTVSGFRSMKDGKHYSSLVFDKAKVFVLQYEYATGKVSDTLFSTQWVKGEYEAKISSLSGYALSADEQQLLLTTSEEQVYRRIPKAFYMVYNRKTKAITPISTTDKQQSATFSPDGSKVAFVRNNNLYIKSLADGSETTVTNDGKKNEIINGLPDWVYEEEFEIEQAYQWSPKGDKIAYMRFDESAVKEFDFVVYGKLYPDEYRYKYPKAGEANSVVSANIYNLKTTTTATVDVGTEKDQYIPRITWTKDDNTLAVIRLNRHQNKMDILLANEQGKTKTLLTENSDTYIDMSDDLYFFNDGKHFLMSSDKSGYNHLYLYTMDGKQEKQLTTGNYDVVKVLGVDEPRKRLYYQAAEASAMERDAFTIDFSGNNKQKLTPEKGTNDIVFSNTYDYYITYHSNANTPISVALYNAAGKQVRVLEDNTALHKILDEYSLSKKEFFKFNTDEGVELNGWMIKPVNFDATKRYPVLMFVYGGSGAQTVLDGWDRNIMWYHYLAEQGYMVVSVDGRGTGYKGVAFKKSTYLQLGKLETIDQLATAKYLSKLAYVDATRIGIQGWSFGGYMSSLCITKGADVFKMAIAVAPVTTWRFYDSIYTERYLRTPQENEAGYDDNSPINFADKLKGKFLLIHGMGDDNVHLQNSVEFTTSLLKANKQFDMFYYPNKNHSISGGNTRLNIYTKMTDFIKANL